MDWISVEKELPPHMEPVVARWHPFPWTDNYLTCYNAMYDRERGAWVAKDPEGSGEYIPATGMQHFTEWSR